MATRRVHMTTTVPAYIARTQLGFLLQQVREKKARFVITKSGKPTAVLLGAEDFDDMLEELDPEFQKSLKVAARQYREGKSITLKEYLKERVIRRTG
jgi:prevent-host-death family protein